MELLPKYSNEPNFCGYPYFYVIEDYKCECHECATESKTEGKTITAHVNYDDPQLYCYTCSIQIEASNGAHEEEDSQEELEQQRRDEKNGLYPDRWDDCN